MSVLEGLAHAYVYANQGCKRWDTCAPEALLNASGGRLTGIDGSLYSYLADVDPVCRMGVLACPHKSWHQAYHERIPQSLVENLATKAAVDTK